MLLNHQSVTGARQAHGPRNSSRSRRLLTVLAASAVATGALCATPATPATAATVSTVVFSGTTGTATVGGTLYAKQGARLTVTVTTSSDAQCVDVAGAFTAHDESSSGRSTWTFTTTAPAGEGVKAVTAAASEMNKNGKCTGQSTTVQGSYVLDNTGPSVAATLTPAPNAAGWNNGETRVTWSATDAGSGVAAAQPFQSDTVTANGIVTKTAPGQTDRVGNLGTAGSTTVRVDAVKPTIHATQTKNADGTTTVTFACNDSAPGGVDGSGIATCLAGGSTTNSRTVQPGVTVTGTATDRAGNTSTTSSTAPASDTTGPLLAGSPTTAPNAAGWYGGDVLVRWTASDPESGVPTPPADTRISGEGTGLTSTTTVSNGAGLSTTASSSPAVRIDRTPPSTGLSGTSNSWVAGDVTVVLDARDSLSGVARTEYTVDGGPMRSGSTLTLSDDGVHTVTFRSTDLAGNVEDLQSVQVRIDKTAPTISHDFVPVSYEDGAWSNQDVHVTFTCADQGGSDVASCTTPDTVAAEGVHQVTGRVADGAGNSATDTALVRVDKTPPTLTATASGSKNAAGWYREPVRVTYTAGDELSGVSSAPASEVLGEGENQSTSATVSDGAGNSTSSGVSDIDVDTTAPVLTASFTDGWHTGDVTVDWSCTDALSGPAGQPSDDAVTGEGDNLSSTASCTDRAGNTATETVTGIRIDRHAPTTTARVADPLPSGWYGGPVAVTLEGSDNLSDVVSTSYTVDDGAPRRYDGTFSFGDEGVHTLRFWSEDAAGNVEQAGAPVTLKLDLSAPTTTVVNPVSPDSGWFVTSGIPVAFEAGDAGSGIAATYYRIDGGAAQTYGEPFTADLSTGEHLIDYWSVDLAGNVEQDAQTRINVDTHAPSITGTATPIANEHGWNNTSVEVTFSCADVGSGLQSGLAGCAGNTTLANDGADQVVHGEAVDVAGNASGTDVSGINIDQTKPILDGAPTTHPNAADWYRDDVTVAWTGVDRLSGIDRTSQPADSTITGEGRHLQAGPATIRDRAGNVSDPASVTGVRIDRTAPEVTGVLPAGRNTAGWYRGDVVIGFTCADPVLADGSAGSGVAACPSDVMLKGDGADQSVTSALASDLAGNTSAATTVTGVNIDGHEPQSEADNRCAAINGYCKGDTATVVLSASDVGPSGVKEIRYRLNGGAEQVAAGDRVTLSIPTDGTGSATFSYYAVDLAGNAEPANRGVLDYDNIAPTLTHTLSPAANAADWNNSDVTVHFDARDTDPGSGVEPGSVTPDVLVDTETSVSGRVVRGSAEDSAGNIGSDSVTVRLDKTAPGITGAILPGTALVNGWYTGAVKVRFTCADALSGLAVCPGDVTLTTNGSDQSVAGSAHDLAGNTGRAAVAGISIDNEAPSVTAVNVANGSYTLGNVPGATCAASDSFSGVASCRVTVSGGNASGVGTFRYTAVATDRAGNSSAAVTGTYTVKYRFDGFLQPINDTAHQVGVSTSVFKSGSTVPVKLQLKNAAGVVVTSTSAPVWLTPVRGSTTSAPVDESVYTAPADSGLAYRHDAAGGQYHYNWKTGNGGNYWRIGVALDDGQTYFVNIGLR